MYKGLCLLFIGLLSAGICCSMPAKRLWHNIMLQDGTMVRMMTIGDEHGHWMMSEDGRHFATDNDGRAYALTDQQLSTRKAKRAARLHNANERRTTCVARSKHIGALTGAATNTASRKALVLLVNFSDIAMAADHTTGLFDERFNTNGYTGNGSYVGSVRDYFNDQSYGKLDIDFDIVGPLTLSKNRRYYGANNKDGDDAHPCEMVIESLRLADEAGVDFSQYDWDGDGTIEQVLIIHAGVGEHNDAYTTDAIWAHEYSLDDGLEQMNDGTGKVQIDDVWINTYAMTCELATTYGDIDGIGPVCHELSHCFGMKDAYDTEYNGGPGMMDWSITSGGSYCGPQHYGEVPVGFTAYERWTAGWIDPVVLSAPCDITDMPSLQDEGVAYIIYNDNNPNEYFLLENRQCDKWYKYPGGHGLLITHIDYDQTAWDNNTINTDPKHQRMSYVAADGSYGETIQFADGSIVIDASTEDYMGDTFPGTSGNTAFTDTSVPAITLFTGNMLGKPITDIVESDGKIAFSFMGGLRLDAPTMTEATEITANGFVANWTAAEDATSYELQYALSTPEDPIVLIDADRVVTPKNTFKTNLIDAPADGKVMVTVEVSSNTKPYDNVQIKIMDAHNTIIMDDNGKYMRKAVKTTTEKTTYDVTFEGIRTDFIVSISPDTKATIHRATLSASQPIKDEDITTHEGITSTSFTLTDLTPGTYVYRVRSLGEDNRMSNWTEWSIITLQDATRIVPAPTDKCNTKAIYNLQGQRMNKLTSKGLYIINNKVTCN